MIYVINEYYIRKDLKLCFCNEFFCFDKRDCGAAINTVNDCLNNFCLHPILSHPHTKYISNNNTPYFSMYVFFMKNKKTLIINLDGFEFS